jgi:GT2 family glycosyltransferase
MRKAAIVILNYNGINTLQKFLPSVVAHSTFEIIVADNNSADDSIDFLKHEFPDIALIVLDQNYGFAGGYTQALKQIEGKYQYYILLNSDVEVTADWDANLIEWLETNPETAAVQPKILSAIHQDYFDHAGAAGGYLDSLGYPYCRGRIFTQIEKDQGQYNDVAAVDWTSGACMAVQAKLFHEYGGFDPLFFAHMEEIDFCWRLRNDGWKLQYLYSIAVYHQGGATLSRSNPFKTLLNFRNSLLTLKKNQSPVEFRKTYLKKIALDILAALVFAFRGQLKDAVAVLRAHGQFLSLRNQLVENKGNTVPSSFPTIRSILWEYYLLGKRKFSEL